MKESVEFVAPLNLSLTRAVPGKPDYLEHRHLQSVTCRGSVKIDCVAGNAAASFDGKSMLDIPDSERAFLIELRCLGTDVTGREILVGLTVEDSAAYLGYVRVLALGKDCSREAGTRYLELHDKHERVRRSVLNAEIDARNDASPRH